MSTKCAGDYSQTYPSKKNKDKRLHGEEIRTSVSGVTRTTVDFNSHTKRQKATEYHFDLSFTFYSKYTSLAESQVGPRRGLLFTVGNWYEEGGGKGTAGSASCTWKRDN